MSREERRRFRSLSATERHRFLIDRHTQAETSQRDGFFSKEEEKDIRKHHRFILSDNEEPTNTWAATVAKKYYQRLFKEYCIVDLSLYEHGCMGTRWRTENEVKEGKGQFICASTKCTETEELGTYEVNFSYSEQGIKKQALVKVRLCEECKRKINYKRTVLKDKIGATLKKSSQKRKNQGDDKHKAKREKKAKEAKVKETTAKKMERCLNDLFL